MTRLTVHCGLSKTGTTALQAWLSHSRHHLLSRGILYPTPDRGNNHKWLTPAFIPYELLPQVLTTIYDRSLSPSQVLRRSTMAWNEVVDQSMTQHIDEVVLSSGTFFRMDSKRHAETFRTLIESMATEVRFVLYLRDPVSRYHSLVRHTATHYGTIEPFSPLSIRPFEKAIQSVFGDCVMVRRVAPRTDISADFLQLFPRASLLDVRATSVTANESLSNEAILLLIEYRRRYQPTSFGRRTWQNECLTDLLSDIDQEFPSGAESRLVPEVQHLVWTQSTERHHWAETYGVSFDAEGRYSIGNDCSFPTAPRFEDLCVIDRDRYEVLSATLKKRRARLVGRFPRYYVRMKRRMLELR